MAKYYDHAMNHANAADASAVAKVRREAIAEGQAYRVEANWAGQERFYWNGGRYDALGLALTGFVVTLGPGVYVAVAGDVLAGILLALTGLLKAPAYMLGFAISKAKGTEIGEWVSGGLRWAAAAAIGLFLWV